MHDILESEELDKALDDCEVRPSCLLGANIDNIGAPSFD